MPNTVNRALLVATVFAMAAPARSESPQVPPAPIARVESVTDDYFGEQVIDRYRWMEDDRDPAWLPFLKAQNEHTRGVLDPLPGRQALLRRIRQLSGDTAVPVAVQRAGGRLFFQQRPAGANNFKLFIAEGKSARVLIDPTVLDTATGHMSLDWWRASPDGAKIVYGLSRDGSEDSVLQIIDVKTGSILPERISNTEDAEPQWLPDGSGFFYNQLTGKVATPERYLDSRARLHRLGSVPAADPIIMARGLDPAVVFENIQEPHLLTASDSDRVLLVLEDVRSEVRLLIAPLADVLSGSPRWQPIADFPDEVTDAELDSDSIYLLANRGHPRGRVLKLPIGRPDLAAAIEVVPESATVLQNLTRARDGLYLRAMDGGVARLQRLGLAGELTDIALPFDGTVSAVAAEAAVPGATLIMTGWLTAPGIWSVDLQAASVTRA